MRTAPCPVPLLRQRENGRSRNYCRHYGDGACNPRVANDDAQFPRGNRIQVEVDLLRTHEEQWNRFISDGHRNGVHLSRERQFS